MHIRALQPDDQSAILDLTIATFRPFHEESFRPLVGDLVFWNRHGNWREDYREHLAGLHQPDAGRFAAVAEDDDGIIGYVGWILERAERHGEIDILAVVGPSRGAGVGRALAQHAIDRLTEDGAEVVSVGTGGDAFHAPARALYEELGFTAFPNVSYTLGIRKES